MESIIKSHPKITMSTTITWWGCSFLMRESGIVDSDLQNLPWMISPLLRR